LKRNAQTLIFRTAPRNQERAIVQSIEDNVNLVPYESGRRMNEGVGIELPRTVERSPGTAMPSVPNSVGGVQGETATASSSKYPVTCLAGTSNSAFVKRGVKRKSRDPETPRKKIQKFQPQDSNNIERVTQNQNVMRPPREIRQAGIRGQEKTRALVNFFRQSRREVSQAIQDGRAAPIISCNCKQSNCPFCSGLNSRDDEE
jgi:hypothetical protein